MLGDLQVGHPFAEQHHHFADATLAGQLPRQRVGIALPVLADVEHLALHRLGWRHGQRQQQPGQHQYAGEGKHAQRAVVAVQPAAGNGTGKQAERLGGIIHADRGSLGIGRGDFRDQRRQRGFQDVEGDEVQPQPQHDQPEAGQRQRHADLRGGHQRDGGDEYLLQLGLLLAVDDGRHHQEETGHDDGQVHLPVLRLVEAAGAGQCERDGDEHRHLRRVQREDAEVEPLQLAVAQHRRQARGVGAGVGVEAGVHRVGDDAPHAQQRQQRQHAGEHEDAVDADIACQQRSQYQADGKGGADAHADDGHGAGAHFFTGEVGEQGGDHRRDGAGALDDAAHGQHHDVVGAGGDEAAGGEQQQAAVDDLLAANLVGEHAQRQLQQRLHQAVAAQRDADQGVVVGAAQGFGVERKDGEDKEHAQHAQGVDSGQAKAGA